MTSEKTEDFKVAFLTGATIFIMGYVNALSMQSNFLGLPVTPQTGNILWIGMNAGLGNWSAFVSNIALFLGFSGGVIFALFMQNVFKNKTVQFFFNWSIFVVPIMIYPFELHYQTYEPIAWFLLSFSAGSALGFFRKFYHLEINNAMATGNVRFLALHFAGAFLKKNPKEVATFFIFLICTALFALGAFTYVMMYSLDYMLDIDIFNLDYSLSSAYAYAAGIDYTRMTSNNSIRVLVLLIICVIPYLFAPKNKPS